MDEETNKKIEEIFQNLPTFIQKYIQSNEWKKVLGDIITKQGLMLDLATDLETEIFLIMIGIEKEADLENLLKNYNIPKEKLPEVVREINDRIFVKMKEKLIAVTENEIPEEVKKVEYEAPVITPHSKDDILKEIELEDEKASAPETIPTNPLAQKLNTGTTNQTEEINLTNKADQKPTTPQNYQSADPYREPVH